MAHDPRPSQDLLRLYADHRRGFERLYEELVTAHRHAARLRADLVASGVVDRRRPSTPRSPGDRPHTLPL